MKIITITFIALFSLLFSTILTSKNTEKVVIQEGQKTNIQTRSIVFLPDVWIDSDTFILSMQFKDTYTVYVVSITDENGTVLFQDTFISDGDIYDYFLPSLSNGYHNITIYNSTKSYTGSFFIYN